MTRTTPISTSSALESALRAEAAGRSAAVAAWAARLDRRTGRATEGAPTTTPVEDAVYDALLTGAALGPPGLGDPVPLGPWIVMALHERARAAPGERARDGVFYTPPALAALLTERALRPVLAERWARACAATGGETTDTWRMYRSALGEVSVLDPACGSGAFLLAAFELLSAERDRVDTQLAARGERPPPARPSPQLYGMDLDEGALVVARRALVLRGAPADAVVVHRGDALEPGDWSPDWPREADVILGNPPFVRHERLVDRKARLRHLYQVYQGTADLYVFFVELGLRRLRPGGRLGMIVPNKWLRAGYATGLRSLLARESSVEWVADLGHARVFAGADAFPSLVVARRTPPTPTTEVVASVRRLPWDNAAAAGLAAGADTFAVPQSRLGGGPWRLTPPGVDSVLSAMARSGVALAELGAPEPLYGVKTGLNRAFVVDGPTAAALRAADPRAAELLRPFLRGADLDRGRAAPARAWLLALRSSDDHRWPWTDSPDPEATFSQVHPSVYRHLLPFADALRARSDQGRFWWELRRCTYDARFGEARLAWPDLCWRPSFAPVPGGVYTDNTTFMIPGRHAWLLAVLNSRPAWFWLWHHAVHGKDEVLRLKAATVRSVPIPEPSPPGRALAEAALRDAEAGLPPDPERERALAALVAEAYGFSAGERARLDAAAPPRSPA